MLKAFQEVLDKAPPQMVGVAFGGPAVDDFMRRVREWQEKVKNAKAEAQVR